MDVVSIVYPVVLIRVIEEIGSSVSAVSTLKRQTVPFLDLGPPALGLAVAQRAEFGWEEVDETVESGGFGSGAFHLTTEVVKEYLARFPARLKGWFIIPLIPFRRVLTMY